MTLRFANVDYRDLNGDAQLPTYKARINKAPDRCVRVRGDALEFLMADKYKPDKKFHGHITLVRAEHGAAREEDVGRDYGISQ
ncbi:CBR-FASN-1 protein [Aphelenchoides fujianensis]|nr:CBR-FASN-1 protein [Aphelenchoides fujianensis]